MPALPIDATGTPAPRADRSSFTVRRFLHELGDAMQQPAGAAAIEHAVIEAERELRFGHGHELCFRLVPDRHVRGRRPGRARGSARGAGSAWPNRGRRCRSS